MSSPSAPRSIMKSVSPKAKFPASENNPTSPGEAAPLSMSQETHIEDANIKIARQQAQQATPIDQHKNEIFSIEEKEPENTNTSSTRVRNKGMKGVAPILDPSAIEEEDGSVKLSAPGRNPSDPQTYAVFSPREVAKVYIGEYGDPTDKTKGHWPEGKQLMALCQRRGLHLSHGNRGQLISRLKKYDRKSGGPHDIIHQPAQMVEKRKKPDATSKSILQPLTNDLPGKQSSEHHATEPSSSRTAAKRKADDIGSELTQPSKKARTDPGSVVTHSHTPLPLEHAHTNDFSSRTNTEMKAQQSASLNSALPMPTALDTPHLVQQAHKYRVTAPEVVAATKGFVEYVAFGRTASMKCRILSQRDVPDLDWSHEQHAFKEMKAKWDSFLISHDVSNEDVDGYVTLIITHGEGIFKRWIWALEAALGAEESHDANDSEGEVEADSGDDSADIDGEDQVSKAGECHEGRQWSNGILEALEDKLTAINRQLYARKKDKEDELAGGSEDEEEETGDGAKQGYGYEDVKDENDGQMEDV